MELRYTQKKNNNKTQIANTDTHLTGFKAKILSRQFVQVDIQSQDGLTALGFAASAGHLDVLTLLSQHNAKVMPAWIVAQHLNSGSQKKPLRVRARSGRSRGQLGSLRRRARRSAGPPARAAFPPEAPRLELRHLLRPEGGEQEPGAAASADGGGRHGSRRGTRFYDLMRFSVPSRWLSATVGVILYGRLCLICWSLRREITKRRRRDLGSTQPTACGGRQVRSHPAPSHTRQTAHLIGR